MIDRLIDPAPRRAGLTEPSRPAEPEDRISAFEAALRRPSPSGAVVVYKRRKRALVEAGASTTAATDPQRRPRVFQVPGSADTTDTTAGALVSESADAADASTMAPSAPPAGLPRRRRRNALHRPGQVHHIVFATAGTQGAPDTDAAAEVADERTGEQGLDLSWRVNGVEHRSYLAVREGLTTLDRTLQAVQRALQFQAAIDSARRTR